jgi:hypothetical protein
MKRSRGFQLAMSLGIWMVAVAAANAQPVVGKLHPGDGSRSAFFGQPLAADGSRFLVGSSAKRVVYVFEWNGVRWAEQGMLASADTSTGTLFGRSVSLSGGRALVGSPFEWVHGDDSGVAYVYEWNGRSWIRQAKLAPTDVAEIQNFGRSLSLDGHRALIGARGSHGFRGSAYIFEWDGHTWSETAVLQPEDEARGFGQAVAIDGSRAVIGAGENPTGSARIYEWEGGTWRRTATLVPSDAEAGDRFGNAVALDGERVAVGANGKDWGDREGAVYVFEWDGAAWTQQAALAPDPGDILFGSRLSLLGDRLLVSAGRMQPDRSAVYLFEWDGSRWGRAAKLVSPVAATEDQFGSGVALSDLGHAYVGDISDEVNGPWSGAVYVFDLGLSPSDEHPERFLVRGNYPNPFRSVTRLTLDLPEQATVRVAVFDLLGRRVHTAPARVLPPGLDREIRLDVPDLPSGVYLYRLTARMPAERFVEIGRMVILE